MEITLEQSLAAAVRYVQDHLEEGTCLYFDDMPENFCVPSVYFPVPRTVGKKVTFDTYLMTIYFEAWFMANTDWQAEGAAAVVRESLLIDNCRIDSRDIDGNTTGKIFHVTDVETNPVETGIIRLSFGIQHYFSRAQETKSEIGKIVLSMAGKPDTLYSAWIRATESQRKEEEVKKEWLEKAIRKL